MRKIQNSEWYKTRPKMIQEMVDKWPPGKYVMLSTGADYYVPYSYSESGTMTVTRFDAVTNKPMFHVFGIKPEELLPIPEIRKTKRVKK